MADVKELYKLYVNRSLKFTKIRKNGSNWSITTVYKIGKKRLVFVGCNHSDSRVNRFQDLMRDVFRAVKPEIALIETGKENVKEVQHRASLYGERYISEKELVASLAKLYHSKLVGMDIENSKNLTVFTEKEINGSWDLAAFAWFCILIQQDYNLRMPNAKYIDGACRYAVYRNWFVRELKGDPLIMPLGKRLPKAFGKRDYRLVQRSFDNFIVDMYRKYVRYEAQNESIFRALSDAKFIDWLTSDRRKINGIEKALVYWLAARDASMINNCVYYLKRYDSVVAVSGNAHLAHIRQFLKEELSDTFGNTEMLYWNKYKIPLLKKS